MVLSIDACPAEGSDYPFGWNFEPKWIDFVLRHGAFRLHCRRAQYCGRDCQDDGRRNDDAMANFSVHIRPSFLLSIPGLIGSCSSTAMHWASPSTPDSGTKRSAEGRNFKRGASSLT